MPRTTLYNGKGSPQAEEAMKTTSSGFKRGGKARKRGGKVDGEEAAERLDKRARGGSVFSSGRSGKDEGSKNSGHEGESVPNG